MWARMWTMGSACRRFHAFDLGYNLNQTGKIRPSERQTSILDLYKNLLDLDLTNPYSVFTYFITRKSPTASLFMAFSAVSPHHSSCLMKPFPTASPR
jgi:hypothetical protein